MDERNGEIERLETEIRERQERLAELRRAGPRPAAPDHALVGPDGGAVHLVDLFGAKDDLLLVHNMGSGCPYCTLWADGFQGVLPHLEDRAAFVVLSPDPPETQAAFARARGWRFRMVSDATGDLTRALGFLGEHDGCAMSLPGVSAFHRDPDGTIRRTARAPFGPGDPYAGIWHLFDLLDGGAAGWEPAFRYGAS